MRDISTLMIRARYALEPKEESDCEGLSEELEQLLDSIRRSLEPMSNNERVSLVEEIEAFSIQIDENRGERTKLSIVNG